MVVKACYSGSLTLLVPRVIQPLKIVGLDVSCLTDHLGSAY